MYGILGWVRLNPVNFSLLLGKEVGFLEASHIIAMCPESQGISATTQNLFRRNQLRVRWPMANQHCHRWTSLFFSSAPQYHQLGSASSLPAVLYSSSNHEPLGQWHWQVIPNSHKEWALQPNWCSNSVQTKLWFYLVLACIFKPILQEALNLKI